MSKIETKKGKAIIQDMTEGNILRHMLLFAIPLLIGNIFQQIYSVVDTMVAGYTLGDSAIAAIGATHFMSALIISTANGFNNGFAIVVTQNFGAGDRKKMRQSIAGMIMLNVGLDVVLSLVALIFLKPFLGFMEVPDAIFQDSYNYVFILFAGMVGTICYNMFSSILRSVGNSKAPLVFLIICSCLNVVLDLLFMAVLGMGVAGAALATIISQVLSAILSGIYLLRNYQEYLPKKEDFKVPGTIVKDLMTTGLSMAMMMCIIDIGSIFYQRANNALGELYITAHSAAYKYANIFMMPLGSLATASSTFTGQNYGARKPQRIKTMLRLIVVMELIWSGFSIALIYCIGGPMIKFLTNTSDPAVIENGVLSLRAHFSFLPFLGFLMPLRTSMQSMSEKMAPLISSGIELVMKILSAFFVIPVVGFIGTCFTEPIIWFVMLAFLVAYYFIRRKKMFASIETA